MSVRITIDEETEDIHIKELADVLNGKETPFKLPSFASWPSADKKRAISERGLKLMLAGLEAIKEKFPKDPIFIIEHDSNKIIKNKQPEENEVKWP